LRAVPARSRARSSRPSKSSRRERASSTPSSKIQHTGTEQGYNTDAAPQFDEKSSATHNHSILLADIPIVIGDGSNGTIEGLAYREFLFDATEALGGTNRFLSLDRLQIFQGSGSLTNYTGSGFAGADLVYDLDAGADRWIALNSGLSSGSGSSDIRILIPDSYFINDAEHRYVTLYSAFGLQGGMWSSGANAEQWGLNSETAGSGNTSAFVVTKTATVDGGTANVVGEVITYTIKIGNVGDTNLTGIAISDPLVADLAPVLSGAFNVGDANQDGVFNGGETWSYSAHYTVTQADFDASGGGDRTIQNTVTVDTDQTGAQSATASVAVEAPALVSLTKTASVADGTVDTAGEVITYAIALTNGGSITLTDPVVSDLALVPVLNIDAPVEDEDVPVFIPVVDGDFILGDTNQNGVPDPGETFQYVYPGVSIRTGSTTPARPGR
jgi:uncharacterized repeat protein (TIGR01451 family)